MARLRFCFSALFICFCLSALLLVCSASETDSVDYVDGGLSETVSPSNATVDSDLLESQAITPAVVLSSEGGGVVGCYFYADCVLGNGMCFYVSPDKIDFLRVDADGYIFNCSDSTVYLAFVDDVSTYSISAPRFSRFSYRGDGYTTADLMLRVNDATVLPSASSSGYPLNTVNIIIICFGLFCVALAVLRRSFAYG